MFVAPLHERADRGRGGVQDRYAVPLAEVPEAVLLGPVRGALVHDARRAVRERAVDEIGVPRHPSNVRGAPEYVVIAQVEYELRRRGDAGQVAAGRVDDALRFAGRTR